MSGVPWFPAWGLRFSTPVDNVPKLISEIEEWRLDSRWSLISYEVAASEVHLWSAWHKSRSNEEQGKMVARDHLSVSNAAAARLERKRSVNRFIIDKVKEMKTTLLSDVGTEKVDVLASPWSTIAHTSDAKYYGFDANN